MFLLDDKEPKPKVKKWLYRKIFLDDFKTFEYYACKRRLPDFRRNIDTVIQQQKKKKATTNKSSSPKSTPTPPNQVSYN